MITELKGNRNEFLQYGSNKYSNNVQPFQCEVVFTLYYLNTLIMTNSKLTLATFILLLISSVLFAQRQKIDVSSFDGIALRTSATVYVTQGNALSVEIEGDAEDLENIRVEVEGDRLEIKNRKDNWGWSNRGDVKVYVTVSSLNYISVSGSGNMIGKGTFKNDELKASVSGSGDIEFDVEVEDLTVKISGSGSIELGGSAGEVKVGISGSGRLDAEDMVANTYDVSISGSGKCRINVKEEIESHISGSGSVYYKGDPKRVNNSSSGSGKIRKI